MRLTASDEERVQVIGDDTFPVNRGQLCIKGFSSAELLNRSDRVLTPLVRGAGGRLLSASWDAALSAIVERVQALQARFGNSTIGTFGSGALTNEKTYLLGKFTRLVLNSPNIDYNGRYCMSSAAAGQNRAFGIDRGLPFPVSDLAETEVLVLWGANCAETMPPIMQWVLEQKARGGTLFVVDPRRSATAQVASKHIQPTPGSDLTLARALLRIAIEHKWVDEAFVRERTDGFEELRRSLLTADPSHAERVTGVPIQDQIDLARSLALAERSMLLSGRGAEQQAKGTDTVLALTNLMLALGKVGKPASGYGCLTGQGNGQGGREHGQKADQLPGYRLIEDPEHRAAVAAFWGVDPDALPRAGKSAYELLDSLGPEGGIRALLVFGSNVAVASPNAGNIIRRLRALDLLVVCDAYLNETADHAHVVLPVTQWAEEEGTMTNLEGRVILRERRRAAPPNVKTDIDVLCELARRLGHPHGFEFTSSEQVFEEFARVTKGAKADYSGISYARIRAERGVFWPCPAQDHPGTPRLFADRFFFPNGRAKFHAVIDRPSAELPDTEYPLYFTTGRYKEHYNSGAQTRGVATLTSAKPAPRLQIHPRLAERLEIADGGLVAVESRRGSVHMRVEITPDIRPDTVFAPFHWGGKQSANLLTVAALDPKSRMPEFKVCAVRVRPAPLGSDHE